MAAVPIAAGLCERLTRTPVASHTCLLGFGEAQGSRTQLTPTEPPLLVREVFHTITRINQEGTTVLLVEQNARGALRIAHRGYVLETGRMAVEDRASALLSNEQVKRAYLGSAVALTDDALTEAIGRNA